MTALKTNDIIEVLAIIPARGGSKGIPKKNITLLAGKPLIAHTIRIAQKSKKVNRIIVSTDDAEIAKVSKRYGAEVINRPVKLSGDTASSEAALIHCLDYLERKEKYLPDILVFLQCTSPLTLTEDIDGAIKKLIIEDADTCFAAAPFHYFLWKINSKGNPTGINHDQKVRNIRQKLEKQYIETGSVYVMRANKFKNKKHRFFGKSVLYEIPYERCWEIDEPMDLEIAEVLMKK